MSDEILRVLSFAMRLTFYKLANYLITSLNY